MDMTPPRRLSDVAPSTAPRRSKAVVDRFIPCRGDVPGGGMFMLCPQCGSESTHVDVVTVAGQSRQVTVAAAGEDEASVARSFEGAPPQAFTSPRRHAVTLFVRCEEGCRTAIGFVQHKGMTLLDVQRHEVCSAHSAPEPTFDSEVERQFWDAHTALGRPIPDLVPQYEVTANGKNYRLDFYSPSRRKAIEVDGLAFHNGQESFIRDRNRQRDLEMSGTGVLRFAAKEVMNDAAACVRQAAQWAAA